MVLALIKTADGSDTLFRRDLNQHYHSIHGALQESTHIFLENGFRYAIAKFHPDICNNAGFLNILEIGFGTGLNAFLTLAETEKHGISVHYTAIEPFPLEMNYWQALNYPHLFGSADYSHLFAKLHLAPWNIIEEISPHFTLEKIHSTIETYLPPPGSSDLVYFDAFGPDAQPELWTEQIFHQLCYGMSTSGILVTYSVKGIVVRALQAAGFSTEKLPGPPGKRHILRATKK